MTPSCSGLAYGLDVGQLYANLPERQVNRHRGRFALGYRVSQACETLSSIPPVSAGTHRVHQETGKSPSGASLPVISFAHGNYWRTFAGGPPLPATVDFANPRFAPRRTTNGFLARKSLDVLYRALVHSLLPSMTFYTGDR